MSNPNLRKIIKLTQAQYDILSNGGTVGDYTGLNDNYLYLIQSDSPDLPIVGSGDKNKVLHTNSSTGELEWSGNYVDLTSDQTVSGKKTIIGVEKLCFKSSNISPNSYAISSYNPYVFSFTRNGTSLLDFSSAQGWTFYYKITPNADNSYDIGANNYRFKNIFLSGNLSDGTYSIAIANIVNKNDLSTVATSGSYNDLTDKPTIPVVDYPVTDVKVGNTSIVTNKVAILGSLASKDTISSGDVASGYYLPTQYISQASANGNTLTLTSVGGTSLTYTPTFTEQHVGDVVSVGATSGSHISIGGTTANPTIGVESGYSIPSTTNQTNWSNKYDKPSTGIPASDLAEEYYLASNPNGYTSNTGTVTSVRVQAGAGLVSSQSTAQTSTLNTTISIDSGYKLPTTSEWNSKADVSAIPTVNDATLTIQQNGTNINTFTANSSSNKTANIVTPQIEDWRS